MSQMKHAPITIRTFTCKDIDVLYPRPEDVGIADIARGLATQVRFNGHISHYFYSVAEHSVNVAYIVQERGGSLGDVRSALLHDAAESYVGDIVGPVKRALRELEGNRMSTFDLIEERWATAIGLRFGVRLHPMPAIVKEADLEQLHHEDRDLRGIPLPPGVTPRSCVRRWAPFEAERLFLAACAEFGIR